MDGINQVNGTQGVQFPKNQGPKESQNPEEMNNHFKQGAFNVEITQLGQLFSAVEEMDDSAKSELRQFHENLFEALQSRNFSAEELAENASDKIKSIAEETGIDLVTALTEFEEHAQQMQNNRPKGPPPGGKPHGPPPPPPPDDLYDSDDEEYTSIFSDTEN